jgi:hypothetical protein
MRGDTWEWGNHQILLPFLVTKGTAPFIVSFAEQDSMGVHAQRRHNSEKENVLKGCVYNAAVATADNRALVVAGSDCKIKELEDAGVRGEAA